MPTVVAQSIQVHGLRGALEDWVFPPPLEERKCQGQGTDCPHLVLWHARGQVHSAQRSVGKPPQAGHLWARFCRRPREPRAGERVVVSLSAQWP